MIEQEVSLIENATRRILDELNVRRAEIIKQIDALNGDLLHVNSEIERYKSIAAQIGGNSPTHPSGASLPLFKISGTIENKGSRQAKTLAAEPSFSGTVRGYALLVLESIYPRKARAKIIQQMYENDTGNHLHEKTMGMTLYRLLKDGLVTRAGWDWQFVPQSAAQPTESTKENPADDTAGDFNDA